MNNLKNRTKIAVFLFLAFLLGILFVVYSITQRKIVQTTQPSPLKTQSTTTPSITPEEKNPSYKKDGLIPTYPPERGSGVDLEAPLVLNSMNEIKKIYPFLPYEATIKISESQSLDVVIPDKASQINPWTLQINIYGLDYGLSSEDVQYTVTKNAFITTVNALHKWLQEKGVDSKKIMIIWGEQEYIQNKSQEWLK